MGQTKDALYTPLRWGRSPLTAEDEESSFLAVGASGSGKTIVLRCLMQSVLCDVGKGNGTHGLVYDPKNDAMSVLSSFVDRTRIKLFNPVDKRCVCWNASKDIVSPLDCEHLANGLIPQRAKSDFFDSAARVIIQHLAMAFNLSGIEWTLADLLRAFRSKEARWQMLTRHPETEYIADTYLADPKIAFDITASIDAICGKYAPLASCFEKATEKCSISDCLEEEVVVVLGIYEGSRKSIQGLNAVLSSIYTHRVMEMPEYSGNRYWQFYDELGEAGLLSHLVSFSKLGRSKGGRLVISLQSLAGLQKEELYSKEGTEDLLSNFGNRYVGRVEDPTTAKWLSDYVGEQDIEQLSHTTSHGNGASSSTTRSKQNQRTLLPSEFMLIPPCGQRTGLTGLFKLRSTVPYWDHIGGQKLFHQMLLPPAADVPGFVKRDIADQYLRPWTAERARNLELEITHRKKPNIPRSLNQTNDVDLDIELDPEPDIDLTDFRP